MRRKLTLLVDEEVVQEARKSGLTLSRVVENILREQIIRTHTYTYVHSSDSPTVQPEIQSTEHGPNYANRVQNITGWRVGRNPPSVLSDIHLIGIPAPLAEVTGAYYSFHGVGWHFTLTVRLLNASASLSTADRGSFCA